MARDASLPVVWTQYLAARLAAMSLTVFEPDANLATAAALGRGLFDLDRWAVGEGWAVAAPLRRAVALVLRGRHRRAMRQVEMAFPRWTGEAHARVARGAFEHLVQLALEVLHTPWALHRDSWPGRLRLHQLGPALELLNSGRPAILLTGHVGNWEVLGYAMALLGYRCDAIARPLDNPLINDWLLGVRQRQGMRIITKWNATDRMIEVLRGGGMLGFIADQNAGDKGLFVPFFGKLASTYKSIGLLAIDQNVPIICGYAQRLGGRYRFEIGVQDIIHPRDWSGRDDPLYYVTARYMRAIEGMVRRCPEQYLWMHRRWKSRPPWERQGKPMPEAMRRRLEVLPWMDAEMLQSLQTPPVQV